MSDSIMERIFARAQVGAKLPDPKEALPGRPEPIPTAETHYVLGGSLKPPFAAGLESVIFGLGCFWGAEKKYWETPGVVTTAVGYSAGFTPNPTYEETCTGATGHNEVVLVVFDPERTSLGELLRVFWESHDPTQGMRQGNDVGTQYRSGIYFSSPDQKAEIERSRDLYQERLSAAGFGTITTEIQPASEFYYAEAYHQQYLAKQPGGYCGLGGTGVSCPVGLDVADTES